MVESYADLHTGGTRSTVYYWLAPDTGAALYHTGVNDESTIPFFPDVGAADRYLDQRAAEDPEEEDRFEKYSMNEAQTRKIGDAVDGLTDQSAIEDFLADY